MGMDKALMPFLGIPLIQRLRDRFRELDSEMLVISNQPAGYQFLGLPVFQDTIQGRGALGGLLTALEVSQTNYVGLIAADMPFASPSLLATLLDRIRSTRADAVLPSSPHGSEPLHAVYHREACLPLVRDAIREDLWRMKAWHAQAKILVLDPDETTAAAGSQHTFMNLNTREEFQAAEELAVRLNLL